MKFHWLLLIGIVFIGALLRLYRISEYMTFLGDEGRDALIVKHLLEGDLVGIGPTASVGGFFTGPIYYYFMAPFLWFFRLDPVGPAIMVALFGIATVFLTYWVGKEFFNKKAGLFAATLYAISPLVIAYSRSSWNPNPLPFFSLLTILFIYKAVQKNVLLYFGLAGLFFGIALQLHYIATFLGIIIFVFILFNQYQNIRLLIKQYAATFLGFLAGFSPFLAFEATHGFPNIVTVTKFAFGGTGETGFTGGKFTTIVGDVFFRLFGRLVTRFPPPEQISFEGHPDITVWYYATLSLALVAVGILFFQFYRTRKNALLVLWLVLGIGLFGFYKKPIYDYYFGFMFVLPFLLVGNLFSFLFSKGKIFAVLSLLIFSILVWDNLQGVPFRSPPNGQKDQVKAISQFVLDKAESRPFNFALITLGNSDHGYRYFFELLGNSPITIENEINDPQRKTATDQLLIICEDPNCKPLGHPLWEVAGFGRAEIVGEWQLPFVKVYKLVHYKGD